MANKKKTTIIIVAAVVGFLVLVFLVLLVTFLMMLPRAFMGRGRGLVGVDKIAIVRVEGPIMCGRGAVGIMGGIIGSDRIVEQLERASEDSTVKAVVVRINSPGGTAAAAQEIYHQIKRVRKKGKKVIASLGDIAASGGFYVASAADKVVCNPGTITGSIGVISEIINVEGLLKKIGVTTETIKSGAYKDMGSYFRQLTPAERKMMKDMTMEIFDQFTSDVASSRGVSKSELLKIADGRLLTGMQAKRVKLADEIGNFRSAIDLAVKEAKIKGKPVIVDYSRVTFYELFFGDMGTNLQQIFSYTPTIFLQPLKQR